MTNAAMIVLLLALSRHPILLKLELIYQNHSGFLVRLFSNLEFGNKLAQYYKEQERNAERTRSVARVYIDRRRF
ncbi:MAG: hypothetical protein NXY57DRAFT_1013877 [Lentinula lateritia]|nr:MAG: hypothetical protein NXY57DRAFT_1013877 [Lentinula lateritia]